MRDSFIFYRSFYEAIKILDDRDRLEIYDAICEYAMNDNGTQMEAVGMAIFALIKPQIDANNKRYGNGAKGGRPKTKAKPNHNQSKTKPKPNVNENDNENVNVNDNGGSRGKYDPTNNPQISDIEISNLLKEMNRA